ncbi:MAG: ornithine cyclodeaminase family protein [Rhodospirillales bacterium]
MPALIDALREGFRSEITVPPRHHHSIRVPGGQDATLLLMPAWHSGRRFGVKLVSIFPDNGAKKLPAVQGLYLLASATDGQPLALLDGQMLTVRRTAAASGLAASYLAHEGAETLLMVGTGALAPHLIEAHCAARPIRRVSIWGRDPSKAAALASRLETGLPGPAPRLQAVGDLEAAVAEADIVSCATLSRDPLVKGAWLKPGQHLDLVGAFTPEMRESDDEAVRRAELYVDTLEGAPREGGDIALPLADGVIQQDDLRGDLFALCRGEVPGRRAASAITLFKSVGHALEDLVAAELAYGATSESAT